ncbi:MULTISPECIES: AAA family ATPase [unclassified Mycolicibacterium]|uniref:AAA family ATPase n=1 Tax=unclassified Mycolicibacterium TaxID=2636767 RepID=UPI00130A1336|nr:MULTISPECIES: adenylate/guanylate cyclase domain-containing protein [unclassified Mycolicibacterium]MUL81317.1 AAA family ATPase [Mycolicibacterium sp. CBMA 329]MUL87083.1 AAA family ATPase [Mycolicibacterium sp. CBMA 331]MUL98635.1 AAA family ATPase [Mycolicibacterium sp. CBMA 334]MUM28513.1 AAA family ATPase [Mycolicibacterium sp. CBMA 295]MUM37380.1 AAA family ATPase [Mycolicibacterium sp. CBMA 247]
MTAGAAGVVCGACGTALRATAKFCDECGTPVRVSVDAPEYKQVTVLFADVVRSMDIAATVDIERLRDIMAELVGQSAEVARRYGGGTVEYTGDGVMAVFGAPAALEDHAFRACLASLAIQDRASRLAADVARRDGVTLQLRVGLNSGRVIAGEIGSGALGYRATGEQVGMAQRIESVARPGEVMLSESTARLVEHLAVLAEPEWVKVKGSDTPLRAYRLLGIEPPHGLSSRAEAQLVGRGWEMAALDDVLDRAITGRGGVANVVGPAGIGKSRVAREAASLASRRGVEVIWTFCESHAREVSFHAVTRLLRAGIGITDLHGAAARARLRQQIPDADPADRLLLDDLLGVTDPDMALPQIDPDARRRRLTALVNTVSLARTEPALFIIEDVHWIDATSESMLAEFLTVIPQTPSMVLITARPDYRGALGLLPGARAITLAPLGDSDNAALIDALLGSDPSVGELAVILADRAAGNPFFAEEMVRELVQRGALTGERGGYVCRADVDEVSIPATVQAAIESRIDRLSAAGKRTVYAASVIGARFDAEVLAALNIDTVIDELLTNELIDQVATVPSAEYAFRHPLIRAVAYESQLRSDRAEVHRRVAAAIEAGSPDSVEQNAALIAEHLGSAGELRWAYAWHVRAGAWSANRDVRAARVSWERACQIADQLPERDRDRLPMRIAPRARLCATGWQAIRGTRSRFEELRELCDAAGDKVSLAIGMNGLETELMFAGRTREGSRLASEQMTLLESLDDPAPMVGSSFIAFNNWFDAGEFGAILRWSQTVIDLTDGDATMGSDFGFGSPLASALAWRGIAQWWLGQPGWRHNLTEAVGMATNSDPTTLAMVVGWTYGIPIAFGVLRADDSALRVIEQAVEVAEGSSDAAFSIVQYALATALLHQDALADRDRGLALMTQVRDAWLHESIEFLVPLGEMVIARERASRGDHDATIPVIRRSVDGLYEAGRPFFAVLGARLLVETLLERRAEDDVAEAQGAVDRLAALSPDEDWAIRDITLLRLRTLLARAVGNDDREFVRPYRDLAESLGFEGHLDWAEATAGRPRPTPRHKDN